MCLGLVAFLFSRAASHCSRELLCSSVVYQKNNNNKGSEKHIMLITRYFNARTEKLSEEWIMCYFKAALIDFGHLGAAEAAVNTTRTYY